MSDANNKLLIDDINELKRQVGSLQQMCIEIKVNTDNNLNKITNLDERLRAAETKLVTLTERYDNHKESYKEEIAYQDSCNKSLQNDIEQQKEELKELQGEVNQLRIAIDKIKERHDISDKKRERIHNVMNPVLSWIIIVLLSLLTVSVVYTTMINKTDDGKNMMIKTIEETQK